MNKKSRVSFGPGAASLILIVVILSMTVLGMLALMNARNDSKLCERSVAVVEAGYALTAKAEESVAALDAAVQACAETSDTDEAYLTAVREKLPDGMSLDGRAVYWEETDGLRTLSCQVELAPLGEENPLTWTEHRLNAVTEEIWN